MADAFPAESNRKPQENSDGKNGRLQAPGDSQCWALRGEMAREGAAARRVAAVLRCGQRGQRGVKKIRGHQALSPWELNSERAAVACVKGTHELSRSADKRADVQRSACFGKSAKTVRQ